MSPALSDLPVRKVIRALESVGFVHARTAGSHAVSTVRVLLAVAVLVDEGRLPVSSHEPAR